MGYLEGKKITNHCPYRLIMKLTTQSVKERMPLNMVKVKKEVDGNLNVEHNYGSIFRIIE